MDWFLGMGHVVLGFAAAEAWQGAWCVDCGALIMQPVANPLRTSAADERLEGGRTDNITVPGSPRLVTSVDEDLTYTPFFADFGPLNIGKVVRFLERLDDLLTAAGHGDLVRQCGGCVDASAKPPLAELATAAGATPDARWTVVIRCGQEPHRRANTAFLLGSYAILRFGWTAEQAFAPFLGCHPPLPGFRDAAFGLCTYSMSVLDSLRGLEAAVRSRLFVLDDFDIDQYEFDEQLPHGDINVIWPGKFCAFSGPLDDVKVLADGRKTWHPRDYVRWFKRNGASHIVRLNKACYDAATFSRNGVVHVDLFYPDGGLPPPRILRQFFGVCDEAPGMVGVHCKAGLGRTGTCIGAYMMRVLRWSSRETVAWLRIARPGSVLGPQQQYLEALEAAMWAEGRRIGLPAHLEASTVADRAAVAAEVEASGGRLPSGHRATAQIVLSHLDKDGDGMLDRDEVQVGLIALGLPPTRSLMAAACGEGGTGLCSFDQLLDLIDDANAAAPMSAQSLRELFATFDPAGTGRVPGVVFHRLLSSFATTHNTQLQDSDASACMAELGIGQAGSMVDYVEAVRALSSGFRRLAEGEE